LYIATPDGVRRFDVDTRTCVLRAVPVASGGTLPVPALIGGAWALVHAYAQVC
jgi:hypothetical protein